MEVVESQEVRVKGEPVAQTENLRFDLAWT